MREEELQLQSRFEGVFRRMWIYYAPRTSTMQVIAFPVNPSETYRIFTRPNTVIWKKVKVAAEDGSEREERVLDVDAVEKAVREMMAR